MLCDKNGNRLFRKVAVKIVYPDNILPDKTFIQHAGPHQGFNPTGIDDILMQIVDQLDTLYPWWEFRMVALAPEGRTAKFVFTFTGYRSVKPAAAPVPEFTQPTESNTIEPETAESSPQIDGGTVRQEPAVSGAIASEV